MHFPQSPARGISGLASNGLKPRLNIKAQEQWPGGGPWLWWEVVKVVLDVVVVVVVKVVLDEVMEGCI